MNSRRETFVSNGLGTYKLQCSFVEMSDYLNQWQKTDLIMDNVENISFHFGIGCRISVGSSDPNIMGSCLLCDTSFDDYSSRCRCIHCRMLVLVCDSCRVCSGFVTHFLWSRLYNVFSNILFILNILCYWFWIFSIEGSR